MWENETIERSGMRTITSMNQRLTSVYSNMKHFQFLFSFVALLCCRLVQRHYSWLNLISVSASAAAVLLYNNVWASKSGRHEYIGRWLFWARIVNIVRISFIFFSLFACFPLSKYSYFCWLYSEQPHQLIHTLTICNVFFLVLLFSFVCVKAAAQTEHKQIVWISQCEPVDSLSSYSLVHKHTRVPCDSNRLSAQNNRSSWPWFRRTHQRVDVWIELLRTTAVNASNTAAIRWQLNCSNNQKCLTFVEVRASKTYTTRNNIEIINRTRLIKTEINGWWRASK